jgi:hypothetical protein
MTGTSVAQAGLNTPSHIGLSRNVLKTLELPEGRPNPLTQNHLRQVQASVRHVAVNRDVGGSNPPAPVLQVHQIWHFTRPGSTFGLALFVPSVSLGVSLPNTRSAPHPGGVASIGGVARSVCRGVSGGVEELSPPLFLCLACSCEGIDRSPVLYAAFSFGFDVDCPSLATELRRFFV